MTPLRISATTLEAYRLYVEQDWMEEAALIQTIKREVVPTEAMRLGTAFHSVLEAPEQFRVPFGYLCDGLHFPDATMREPLSLIDPRGTFEVKSMTLIDGHTIVARADQIVGSHIYEHKTTTGSYDADKYLDSCQWRVEAALFQPGAITYRTFLLEEPKDQIVGLRGIEQLTVYPYPALLSDVRDLVRRFVAYVTQRGLTSYLEREGSDVDLAA
ncbi:MAG TPA: hypothetical protein VKE26_26215 [Xanthobacteraceae bacterium]|nr:hypothetical protein [Xanthobacteraceae bacterium]